MNAVVNFKECRVVAVYYRNIVVLSCCCPSRRVVDDLYIRRRTSGRLDFRIGTVVELILNESDSRINVSFINSCHHLQCVEVSISKYHFLMSLD